MVVRRADAARRQWCAEAMVGIGVLVGVSGWIGTAWRLPPLALASGGLWRATSTLTYANAAAALLASLSLLAIAILVARGPSLLWAFAVHLLLVGLGATLSRGGLLTFLVGSRARTPPLSKRGGVLDLTPDASLAGMDDRAS
jgi:hypothetical protein